ncbi:GGDEF domain-containing protein [Acidihalobacter prosperus]|uniref:diguanylate cyclase n=1 Tax=Acidihalobacter prosperus TaxID=160660 RepID=A0A1A6C1N4_9GAMM|nr:GGDEF domain-containing protein [Acidihalobacter prosperus]OBS08468.1 hypothetical protein Thpro_022718 [Acidihalobacter prosperus]
MTDAVIRDIARDLSRSDEFVRTKIRFLDIATPIGVAVALLMSYIELQQVPWFRVLPAMLFPLFAPFLLYRIHRGGYRGYEQGLTGFALLISAQQLLGALFTLNELVALIWFPVFPLTYIFLLGYERAIRWNAVVMTGLVAGYLLFPVVNHGMHPVPPMAFVAGLLAYAFATLLAWHDHREVSTYQRRLYEQASYDALTGAMMREPGLEVLARCMAQVDRRPGEAVSVALLDLDDFKRINDEEGHQAGDRVLRGVAAEVRGHIRRGDYLVRLGGEEFLIVFPGMRAEAAYALSDGLRERIPAVTDGLSRRPVTASIGLVQYRGGETAGQLLGRADVLMYAAKTGGKNRVCREAPPAAGQTATGAIA